MSMKSHGFPLQTCNLICSTPDECLSYMPNYVKCIADMVTNRMCYVLSILSLLLQDKNCKLHETLLSSAIRDLQIVSDWIRALQDNNNSRDDLIYIIKEERRLCPRFKTNEIKAEINGQEYPVLNLSLNGCFINTKVSYPSGTNITLKLLVEGGISIFAVVRHSVENQGIGVEFINIESKKEKEFYSFMADFFLQPLNSLLETQKSKIETQNSKTQNSKLKSEK